MADERRPKIVTFKPKEERADSAKDKLELLSDAVDTRLTVVNAAEVERGATIGVDPETVAYDVDEHDAPIVTLSLTDDEASALQDDPNVAEVEDDQPMYALETLTGDVLPGEGGLGGAYARAGGPNPGLVVEGQPSPLAETIPAGISHVKAPLAWDCSRGKRIKVAVLDTGIAGQHPDLAPNYRGGTSFVPGETSDDGHGHGTHCGHDRGGNEWHRCGGRSARGIPLRGQGPEQHGKRELQLADLGDRLVHQA